MVTLRDKCPSYSTLKNLVARFRTGHLSTEGKEHSGRPTEVTIPDKVDAIHSMILDDRRISIKNIAETLVISRDRVGYIIHEILDMRKLSAQLGSKMSQCCQKHDRVLALQAILVCLPQDPVGFFNHPVKYG
jgi:hypothetical protein